VEPFAHGLLDVGDGHHIYWETSGNPRGVPALVLHGGPGSGATPWLREWFDPSAYLVVTFDQRNAGRSRPHGWEPVVDLSANTTAHLLSDMERLRELLGIDRWLVGGVSWGTTLALAYAEEHPERTTALVLNSTVSSTRAEIDWLTRAMGRVFPAEWDAFVRGVPPPDRDGDLSAAYHRLLMNPDPQVHEPAARAWCAWEDTHVATYAGHRPSSRYDDPRFRLCFARVVTHYFSHAGFLEDGVLLRNALRLNGIRGVMVQGALDISAPPDIAWRLAQVWTDAELVVLPGAGHGGTLEAVRAATDRLLPAASARQAG
jgi:proline iminopeptidase